MGTGLGQMSCEWSPLVKISYEPSGQHTLTLNAPALDKFQLDQTALRAELEDAIESRRADVDAAVGRGPRADARALARAESARANATELLRLHLIIPSASDPAEMIDALQARKWPP